MNKISASVSILMVSCAMTMVAMQDFSVLQIDKELLAIYRAIANNDTEELTQLFSKTTRDKQSLLFKYGVKSRAVAQALIAAKVNVCSCDCDGYSILHKIVMIKGDDEEIALDYIDAGASVCEKDRHGNHPLHLAALQGKINLVTVLLKEGAPVNEPNKKGLTPLYYAAREGHIDVVKKLVAAGASVGPMGKYKKGLLSFLLVKQANDTELIQLIARATDDDDVYIAPRFRDQLIKRGYCR